MEILLSPSPISAVFVFVFLALAVAFTVHAAGSLIARSLPQRVLQRVEELDQRVADVESATKRMHGEWQVTQENLEDLDESIERKRKRIAASASKVAAREEREAAQAPPVEDLTALRQRIYGQPGSFGKL